jgi:hypothetical protein
MNGARDGEPPGYPRVRYDAAHRVLIYAVCQSGVSLSQGLLRHLQRYYKSWPLAARRDLVRAIGAVPLLEPHAVAVPAMRVPIRERGQHTGARPPLAPVGSSGGGPMDGGAGADVLRPAVPAIFRRRGIGLSAAGRRCRGGNGSAPRRRRRGRVGAPRGG